MFSDHNETKLEISKRKVIGKSPNFWKQNNTLPYNPWVKEETSKKSFKTYQNLWDTTKVMLRGNTTALRYIRKEERLPINKLPPQEPRRRSSTEHTRGKKEITVRAAINQTEIEKQ